MARPNGSGSSFWRRCRADNCLGEAAAQGGTCLRHASPEARQQYLSSLRNGSQKALSLRGVFIERALLDEIQASPPASGKTMPVPLLLSAADVGCKADFSGWEFVHHCDLSGAVFHETADFHGALFRGYFGTAYADFRGGPGYFSE